MRDRRPKYAAVALFVVLGALFAVSLAHAQPPFPAAESWTKSGPAESAVTQSSNVLQFSYAMDDNAVWNGQTWEFKTTATEAAEIRYSWDYSGHHAWFMAVSRVTAFVERGGVRTTTVLFDQTVIGPFQAGGISSLQVEPGDLYGFVIFGDNFDSTSILTGVLSVYTSPLIQFSVTGTQGSNGWYTSDASLSWTVTDPASGELTLAGCDSSTLTSDTSAEGITYTCSATSAGGTSAKSIVLKRDTADPVTTDNAPSGWVNTDVVVELTAIDDGSGVASTNYSVNDGVAQAGVAVSLHEEGVYELTYWSEDAAGNTEAQNTATIMIDRTAPVTTRSVVVDNTTKHVAIALNASDSGAGGATTHYVVDGISGTGSSILLNKQGVRSISYWSVDAAGNVEPSIDIQILVDVLGIGRDQAFAIGDIVDRIANETSEPQDMNGDSVFDREDVYIMLTEITPSHPEIAPPPAPTAAEIAAGITSVTAPSADETSLTLPIVPDGYTIEISSSGNEEVVGTNGAIIPPEEDTVVDVVFTVTKILDNTSANTDNIAVTIPARSRTAAEIAAGITSVTAPAADETSLFLPTVPEGYTIEIYDTSHLEIIGIDGTIVPPTEATIVDIIFAVTRTSDNATAYTNVISVTVPAHVVTAAEVAAGIMSVPAPAADETSLTLPTVPDGFTIEIYSSSDEGVIGTDGTIVPPTAATNVDIVFTVTRTSDDSTANTVAISVTVPARLPTAAEVAAGITSVTAPSSGATSLTLPAVPSGYTIEIFSSSDIGVIGTNGAIAPPTVETDVTLVFKITRTSDNTTANTVAIVVTVSPATSNLAAGILPTTSMPFQNPFRMTDGDLSQWSDSSPNNGLQWVQLDLGAGKTLYEVKLWHYYGDPRMYRDVIIQLSDSADFSSGVTTVFNNDADNTAGQGAGTDAEYPESSAGKSVTFGPVNARYVRIWSNGSSSNVANHIVEIEVYGSAVPS